MKLNRIKIIVTNKLTNTNNSGFTLLEVIIAMLIISILISSFLPDYLQSKTDNILLDKTTLIIKNVFDASRWFYNDHQCFPTFYDESVKRCSDTEININGAIDLLFSTTLTDIYDQPVKPYLPSYILTNGKIMTPLGEIKIEATNNPNLFSLKLEDIEYEHAIKIQNNLPNVLINGSSGLVTLITTIPKPGYEAMLEGLRNEIKSSLKKMDITDFEYIGLHDYDAEIEKPACRQDDPLTPENEAKIPQIFVVPYYFSAGMGGPAHGFVSYAEDIGTAWRIKGEVGLSTQYDANGNIIDPHDISMLVIVTCTTPRP